MRARVLALALLSLAGCSSLALDDVTIETIPAQPIPDKPITATVRLIGEQSTGASVSLVVGGSRFALSAVAGEPGAYRTDALTLPGVGPHNVKIEVESDGDTGTWEALLEARCDTNGGAGAACCAADACAKGLACVYGQCSTALAADDTGCHGPAECLSGVCSEGRCLAPTCSDGVRNGKEAAIDCGVGCATGCPATTACVVDEDCASKLCALGACASAAGDLLGPVDKPDVKPTVTTILASKMTSPTDLAFSSLDNNQLWVVDMAKDAFIVIFGAGQDGQTEQVILDKSQHFMERVLAISFADEPTFGTCGDTRNDYGGMAKPNNFMGPVQWPSDINDYKGKQSAHQVHWDMLHSSPYCMGMASSGGTGYYVFNGYDGAIDWYDFKEPHCPGCDDHSDGVKRRYSNVAVKRVAGVPSNLEYDAATSLLYVADTGNGRVLRLDTRNTESVKPIMSFPGDGTLTLFSQPTQQELNTSELKQPSGLAFDRDVLYVGDYATGVITAWSVKAAPGATFGTLLRSFDTGLGSNALVGMTVGPDRKLYFIDRKGRRVMRLDPPAP